MSYAVETSVPVDRSKAEVELMLKRFGADEFAYRTAAGGDQIAFRIHGRFYRMTLPKPDRASPAIQLTKSGRLRKPAEQQVVYDQAWRAVWRALCLHIKARIVAIESGITTMEREFMPDLLLPNRLTAHEWLEPQISESYRQGQMPQSLIEGPRQPRLPGDVIDQT